MSCPRFISGRDIMDQVNLLALIDDLEKAILAGERSRSTVPLRTLIAHGEPASMFGSMPALSPDRGLFVLKMAAFIPKQGVSALVIVQSLGSGEILATLDGAALTELKTSAVSGVIFRQCTAPNVQTAAIIGTGAQARAVLRALSVLRRPVELRVYSRSLAKKDAFCAYAAAQLGGSRIIAASSPEVAVEGADLIMTATPQPRPLWSDIPLPDHAHLHCVGAHTTEEREVPANLMAKATLIVEDLPTAIAEAGSCHATALDLEALLAGSPLADTLSIFSSTGHGFIDLVTAAHVYKVIMP